MLICKFGTILELPLERGEGDMRFDCVLRGSRGYAGVTLRIAGGMCGGGMHAQLQLSSTLFSERCLWAADPIVLRIPPGWDPGGVERGSY